MFVVIFKISVKNHVELWGQNLHSGDLDRKKFSGLKTHCKLITGCVNPKSNIVGFPKTSVEFPPGSPTDAPEQTTWTCS